MEKEPCYMCCKLATSKEHVPPKCIFPESKDMGGEDYRINLITVPSCDIHNLEKSDDDEFLMVSLAGIFGNNSIGYIHRLGKVDRAIRRSSRKLLNKAFIKKKHYLYEAGDNKYYEIIWGTPDHERLEKCFKHIACGIHFHHFGCRFIGKQKILLGYLHQNDEYAKTFVQFIKDKASLELKDVSTFGSNKDVFFYQFTDPDQFGIYLLRLVFYGGIEIYISLIPSDREIPSNLAIELMKRGIHTVITFGDKQYEFNKS